VVRDGPAKLFRIEWIAPDDREPLMGTADLFRRSHQGGYVMPEGQRLFDELPPNSPSGSYNEQSHFITPRKSTFCILSI